MVYNYRLIRNNYFPIIEVIIANYQHILRIDALVDSGASISIFKGEIARAVGIDIISGQKIIFQGASAKLLGYIHKLNLEIGGKKFTARIAFSDDLSTSFNLLGRLDVFDRFLITFNESKKQLVMK